MVSSGGMQQHEDDIYVQSEVARVGASSTRMGWRLQQA